MVVGGRELIDTLWKCKIEEERLQRIVCPELIDTLWNVNFALLIVRAWFGSN